MFLSAGALGMLPVSGAFAACVTTTNGSTVTLVCGTTATTASVNTNGNTTSSDAGQYFPNDVIAVISSGAVVTVNGLDIRSTPGPGSIVITNNGSITNTNGNQGLSVGALGTGSITYLGNGSASGSAGLDLGTFDGDLSIGTSAAPVSGVFTGTTNAISAAAFNGGGNYFFNGGSAILNGSTSNVIAIGGGGANPINLTMTGNMAVTQGLGETGNTGIAIGAANNGPITMRSDANIGTSANPLATGIRALSSDGNISLTQTGGSVFASGLGIAAITSGVGTVSIATAAGASIAMSGGDGIHVTADPAAAVVVSLGGSLTNTAGNGVVIDAGAGDVTVSGTIATTGLAVSFGTVGGNTFTLTPTASVTGNVVATGANTFRLGGDSGTGAFDVSRIGGAAQYQGFDTLTKIGASSWVLSGTSTYTGATSVNGGTLSVNGNLVSSSGVTVNAGGVLSGTGIVGNTNVAGGTFAPGSGTAGSSLNVNGMLTFNAASTYAVNVNATTASFANVSGAAALGGATVNAVFASGGTLVKRYTILNAASIGSTFGALTTTNKPAAVSGSLSYDPTHAYLDIALNYQTPGSGALNTNQSNVANALTNYFNVNGSIPTAFASLNANGLSQASGQPGASTAQAAFIGMDQFVNAVFDAAFDRNGGQGGPIGFAPDVELSNAYASKSKVAREAAGAFAGAMPVKALPSTFDTRWNVWASAYGGNSRVNGDAVTGSSTTTSRVFGAAAGASYRATPNTQLGFALGGAGSNFGVDGGFGGGRADIFNAAVYGKQSFGPAYLAGVLAYSWQDTTTDRSVTVAGTDQLRASFKAQALTARLEGGWRYATAVAGITPYTALQSTTFYMPGYGEAATSGSSTFALNYAASNVTATRAELGARFDKAMLMDGGVFTLKARTAWAHDWNTERSAVATFQTLSGATFTVNGAEAAANAALLSLGAEMKWRNGWSLAGSFDGEFSRTTAGYAGKGSVKYTW